MDESELKALMSSCLGDFQERRLQKLRELKLRHLLVRKNPYILKAVGIGSGPKFIDGLVAEYLGDSDEALFNDTFVDPIARALGGARAYSSAVSAKAFWQEITDDPDFYLKLATLMEGASAASRVRVYTRLSGLMNLFYAEFISDFCHPDGSIDWEKLVRLASEERPPKAT